ncbi:carbamoyltransferase [Bradyrhizobium diazoefficiens]|uniref:carbamoyltransferase family protein n=1 Tax=Bradyrhizobium diazoefficiens TaxID=1355477 RepID=UPI00190C3D1E|nr:carbamoyltransferase C-terminal domain-containing protein [Bradyrhizobium diazoefficiens]QQO17704.1 carbamoyltransferase [Bradyrhizobium diazoefficiens]
MTAILGLNFNHADASAALILDGKVVAAVAEERFGRRIKHDPSFPEHAVRSVLAIGGISVKDIDLIAVPRDTQQNRLSKALYVLQNPWQGAQAVAEHLRRANAEKGTADRVAEACGEAPGSLRAKVVNIEHHIAHIASAYYCSPFEGVTAGFSYDSSGDFVSAMAARCEGSRIEVLDRVSLPNSLGFFYTACCQYIGFDGFGEEYKVMGLAPYGENTYAEFMRSLVSSPDDGWFRLAPGWFGMHSGGESGGMDDRNAIVTGTLYTDKWAEKLGPPRQRGDELTQRQRDIARSCQVRFEDVAMDCFQKLHDRVRSNQIAYAGGCALNGVANARLLRDTPFENVYLQPAASDDGLCIGAAMWAWHNVAGRSERFYMKHAYWGPEYSDSVVCKAAEASGFPVHQVSRAELPEAAARLIRAGLVIGWYQGRSEWGPRALGNRSILGDPTRSDIKDLINAKIKRRELFRPFAPTIVRHEVAKYFEQDVFSPFMMHVVKVRPEWREQLPGITHVDGTGRLQSIERETNPLYFDLIEAFGRQSGIPIVLNTSFNENEPIVDTPEQAVSCFTRTGLDALCLGNYIVAKPEHEALVRDVCRSQEAAAG